MKPMNQLTRRFRIAASPLVAAVALGLLAPAVLTEEDEPGQSESPAPLRSDDLSSTERSE